MDVIMFSRTGFAHHSDFRRDLARLLPGSR